MSPRTKLALSIGVLVVIVAAVIAIAVVPGWRGAFLSYFDTSSKQKETSVVALYENGAYSWYDVTGGEAVAAVPPGGRAAGGTRFPNGATLTVSEKEGLLWRSAEEKTTLTLLEHPGLTREAWAVAPNGSSAVLFNDVTGAFDVFTITYEGAYVSYAGSFPAPTLPTYWVAVGYASPELVVVRTGDPDSFLLYRVNDAGATYTRSLLFTPTP